MSASLVPGDWASLSATGATLTRAGAALAADADALEAAYRDLGREWTGRASLDVRRRGAALSAAGATLAEQLAAVGTALQDHATDLAELAARARALHERAGAEGLEIRGGRVELGYGVTGEAAADLAGAAQRRRVDLQAELDLVLTQLARRRRRLLDLLGASSTALAAARDAAGGT